MDLYATEKEKLEIARLQSEYDKAMDLYGSQWNSEVSACYVRLADYKKGEIQKVTDVRRAASLKAGGAGIRYTCIVDGKAVSYTHLQVVGLLECLS